MTSNSCQGEEWDIFFYSMVATREVDRLGAHGALEVAVEVLLDCDVGDGADYRNPCYRKKCTPPFRASVEWGRL